jgi:hypothetical protein
MVLNASSLAAAGVATSAAVSAALAYATKSGQTVQLPLVGAVSAPLGFAISNAVSTLAVGALAYEGDIPVFQKIVSNPGREALYLQTLGGLGQTAVMKGLATNPNVGLGESFLHGFISPLIAGEIGIAAVQPSDNMLPIIGPPPLYPLGPKGMRY